MGTIPKPDGGSTLIEVIVGLVIFLVVVLGLGNSVLSSRRAGDSSREIAEATTLALDKIEHLRTLLPTSTEIASGTRQDPANPLRSDGATGGPYTRSWTVTSDVPLVGIRRVVMTVSWSHRGRPSSITLVSYLTIT